MEIRVRALAALARSIGFSTALGAQEAVREGLNLPKLRPGKFDAERHSRRRRCLRISGTTRGGDLAQQLESLGRSATPDGFVDTLADLRQELAIVLEEARVFVQSDRPDSDAAS